MCRYETKYQIVLTKTDLVFPIDVARRAMQIEEVSLVGVYLYRNHIHINFSDWSNICDLTEPQSKEICSSTLGMDIDNQSLYWSFYL